MIGAGTLLVASIFGPLIVPVLAAAVLGLVLGSGVVAMSAFNVVDGLRHAVRCQYLSTPRGECDCNPIDESKAMRPADVLRIFQPLPEKELKAFRALRGDDDEDAPMSEPTLDEQIAAINDRIRELQTGYASVGYTREQLRTNNAVLARLEAQRLPLLADPAHPPSADDEREARVRRTIRRPFWARDSDAVACGEFLLRRLDAALVALSGAQKEVALRDAEIARLKEQVQALHETCRSDIRTMGVLHKQIDELRDLNAGLDTRSPRR